MFHRCSQIAALIASLCLAPPPALAQAIPHYDVSAGCERVARIGGTRSAVMFNACMRSEQREYDAIKPRWAALPADIRKGCDRIARLGGSGSYQMLRACVQQEMKALQDSGAQKFRY